MDGYRANARLRGAQSQGPVFGNMRDQHGDWVLASGDLYIELVVTAPVEGVSGRHVLRPNMDDPPESGDGLEGRAE